MCFKRLLILFLVIFILNAYSQEIYQSKGLQLFNYKNYPAAIDSLQKFAQNYSSERGMAYFFIGESYYNLGLSENLSSQEALNYFYKGSEFFKDASNQTDLDYSQYNPLYKRAWCQFRCAELEKNPETNFLNSIRLFSQIKSSNDTIKFFSRYMAAESRIKLSQIILQDLFFEENSLLMIEKIKKALEHLVKSENLLKELGDDSSVPEKLKITANIKYFDVLLERSKLFSNISDDILSQIDVLPTNISKNNFMDNIYNSITYNNVFEDLNFELKDEYKHIIFYSEVVKYFFELLWNNNKDTKQNFISALDSLQDDFIYEKNLLEAHTFFINYWNNPSLNLKNKYIEAGKKLPESYYWLGWLQFIQNDPAAAENFKKYLNYNDYIFQNSRISFLKEDAFYRQNLIKFDNNAANKTILNQINNNLHKFDPENLIIRKKTNSLHNLVKICLGFNIGEIVKSEQIQISINERTRRVIDLVQKMLERATKVVGVERENYLSHLDDIIDYLKILNDSFSNPPPELDEQIIFYNGLKQFLRAEIKETEQLKRQFYIEAAEELEQLNNLDSKYSVEGNYIQARSYFEAARKTSDINRRKNLFKIADATFIQLINEHHSLRSAFYHAEILRLKNNYSNALICYKEIKNKTRDNKENNFWYLNADAAEKLCKKSSHPINNNIKIYSIIYPETLLVENGQVVSMEKFADSKFLKQEYLNTALDYLNKFSLPKLSIYPSVNLIPFSRYKRRSFPRISTGINEKRDGITSGINLCIYPDNADILEVTIDGSSFNKKNNIFSVKDIELSRKAEIKIISSRHYPFIIDYEFKQPGMETKNVYLSPDLQFVNAKTRNGISIIDFGKRIDKNILFSNFKINISSELYGKFNNDLKIRDFCYSNKHNSFFVVNSDMNVLLAYGKKCNRLENFNLDFKNQINLKSPEGIASDTEGNIFIVDWGAHRVLIFSPNGRLKRYFGVSGRSNTSGSNIQLIYPTRIAISEDTQGIVVDNRRIFRQTLLYIADRYGIYITDIYGNYLDTVVSIEDETYGSFYDLDVNGYGEKTIINVVKRLKGDKPFEIITFTVNSN